MKLFMKQKLLSFRAHYLIKDDQERDLYTVRLERMTFGKNLRIYDTSGVNIGSVQQKTFSIRPRYYLYANHQVTAELTKEHSWGLPVFRITGKPWEIISDMWAHVFEIKDDLQTVASVTKEWKTWGDSYGMDIVHREDALLVIEIMIAIDCFFHQQAFAALAGN